MVDALQTPAGGLDYPLSPELVSPGDVRRLKRELTALDDALRQAAIREGGQPNKLPAAGVQLVALAADCGANLLQPADRQTLLAYLEHLLSSAPQLQLSLAGEPSAAFLSKVTIWLRANIHPQLLVTIGLQPSIAAGCIVRTNNRQFDFSLAARFDAQRELLINSLRGALA